MKYLLHILLFLCAHLHTGHGHLNPVLTPAISVAEAFNPEKATAGLIQTIPLETRQKADRYTEGGYWLLLWNFLYAALVGWLFLFGGLSAYIKKLAFKTSKENRRNFIYILLYFLLSFLLTLPLDIYQNFIRERQYGFSNQQFGQWFTGDVVTLLVELLIAAPFFVLVYKIFRKVKTYWWLWGAGITIFFTIVVLMIYPVFITPVFNKYTPLKNGPLKDSLMVMARVNHIPAGQIYVYDESQQTKAFNANVTGFAGTTRIALNDNMLNHCTDKEIKAALGHEMGHYVLHHLQLMVFGFGILIVIGFALVHWLLRKLIPVYGRQWEIFSIRDVTTLPLLVFLFTAYFFLITPVSNSMIRSIEAKADDFGLNTAREPDAFASLCLKTADNHKIAPGYWEEVIFYDHPSRRHRILAAMKCKSGQRVYNSLK